jgi:ferric-dicitrate binding protein FerR (iron transport regulator)
MTPKDPTETPHIKEIILRFLEGTATDKEVSILHQWLQENETNRKYFDEVNNTYHTSVTLSRYNHPMVDNDWAKIANRIIEEQNPQRSSQKTKYLVFLKVAASVCFLIVAGSLLFKTLENSEVQKQGTIVRNSQRHNTRIVLPDGSTVWLNANSTIEYSPDFGHAVREVALKGEAFFDVKKDSKAFIVKTDNMQVHVKGTRFNVEANKKNGTIKTTLEEGKVELHVEGSDKFFTMSPGDQLILDTKLNDVTVQKVDPTNFSAWKEEKLIFDNTPLHEIAAKLENRYKVKITIKSAKAKRELVTMTIEQEEIEEVLEMIKLSSKLRIKMERNEIILYE